MINQIACTDPNSIGLLRLTSVGMLFFFSGSEAALSLVKREAGRAGEGLPPNIIIADCCFVCMVFLPLLINISVTVIKNNEKRLWHVKQN